MLEPFILELTLASFKDSYNNLILLEHYITNVDENQFATR
jgi:hypothetical protein